MKTIALDLMGTDLGMRPAIQASYEFLSKNNNYKIIFVGNSQMINEEVSKIIISPIQYEIVNATEIINQTDGILEIRRKKDSSMVKALELVSSGAADAVVSGGSTSAFLAGCHFILKEIDKIERIGFMPFIPTIIKGKVTLMMDVGANLENNAKDLLNYALMGSYYAQKILKISKPSVGLLNIGSESTKGKEYQKEAYKLLAVKNKLWEFYGNVEPRDITSGIVDIIVTDGYTGNIALKSIEGLAKNLMNLIKAEVTKNLFRKISGLLLKPAFTEIKETFDYKNHAAALVLGLKKIAVKTHGSSDFKSYLSTLEITKQSIENDIANLINKLVNKL